MAKEARVSDDQLDGLRKLVEAWPNPVVVDRHVVGRTTAASLRRKGWATWDVVRGQLLLTASGTKKFAELLKSRRCRNSDCVLLDELEQRIAVRSGGP